MNGGHVPIRTCIGCRRRRPQRELIRLKANGNEVEISTRRGKDRGRGCYVCSDEKCADAALKRGRISRALRRQILVVPSREKLLSGARTKGVAE